MNIIKTIIKKRFSFKQIMFLVILIILIRTFFDFTLLDYPLELDIFQHYARFYLENIYYFLIVFLIIVFFISKIVDKGPIDVANFGVKVFPLIIIPPIIDYFIFGRTAGYDYATIKNFFYNLFTISWVEGDASFGLSLEITLALFLLGLYVYYIKRSFLRTILSLFTITLFLVVFSTPEIFFGRMADYYYFEFLPNYYFFPLMVLSGFLLYHYKKEKMKAILSNIRVLKSLIFVLFVFLGSLASTSLGYTFNLYKTFLASLAIFFVWQFSIVINDIYDYKIDKISNKNRPLVKKTMALSEYKLVTWIFIFFALSFSAILNAYIFLLIILSIILATIYSVPPLRLRKNFLGNLIIGISLVISFMVGILCVGDFGILSEEKNIMYSSLLFLLGTVVTFTKDLKDIKNADMMKLSQILGKQVALSVKKQVGQEIKPVKEGKRKGQVSLEGY